MRVRRNVAAADERRVDLFIYDAGGAPAAPNAIVAGDLLYDPGTGITVPAAGTLTPASKALVVADFTFTTTHGTDTINKTGHGLSTGDGPFTLSNSGGSLPTGYSVATNYWWIRTDDDHGQLAISISDALLGAAVPISSDGTGTHTISDVVGPPSTRRLLPGWFKYTLTQGETNVVSQSVCLALYKDGFNVLLQTVEVYLREMDEILLAPHTRADIERLSLAVLLGPATGFIAGNIVWRCPITSIIRMQATVVPDGRVAGSYIIGTLT